MSDNSRKDYEPHMTLGLGMELKDLLHRPNEDTIFLSDDGLKHDNVHTDLPGKRRIRNLEDEYAKLWQMYGDVEDERDKFMDALDVLASEYAGRIGSTKMTVIESAMEIAAERKALQEAEDDPHN